MTGIKIQKHVDAPLDKVFAEATDLTKWAERMSGIRRVELLTDGPVGVGTRFRETRVMFGHEATEEMEITGFDAPHSYTVEAESHGCRYRTDMSFKQNGNGTDLEMSFQAEPQTFLAKTMATMMKGMISKVGEACSKDLDELKAAIEACK